MTKPVIGLLLGGALGVFDGLSALISAPNDPAVKAGIVGIVVGSTIKTAYWLRDGKPELVRLPEIYFVDDKAGKPVGINKFIGRRPLMAFGHRARNAVR